MVCLLNVDVHKSGCLHARGAAGADTEGRAVVELISSMIVAGDIDYLKPCFLFIRARTAIAARVNHEA